MKMQNKIIPAPSVNAVKKELAPARDVFLVEIDGARCPCLPEYLRTISAAFSFPTQPSGLDGCNDWLRDLTWLDAGLKIAIVIEHFSQFLKEDLAAKKYVLEDFEHLILPWWETDVSSHVVDGRPRMFSVYLID